MVAKYVPVRGDIVWLLFSDVKGREQGGRRPALVLSPAEYNKKTGLCLVCPITSRIKGYSYEVPVDHKKVSGVILANHIRSVSFVERKAEKITNIKENILKDVVRKINFLIS